MFILYDLIFLIFTLIYLPIYLFKGKFHRGFLNRLGILPKNLSLDEPIWIHAVSLGEAISVRGLVEELRKAYPGKRLVISTVTSTGNKIASTLAQTGDLVIYLPLDFSFTVRHVINKINPSIFIIAETEIWPNLISYLYKKGVPVVTVNGRISDASFKGYSAVKFLIKPILNKIKLFCMQTDLDRKRLMQLGVSPERVKVTGNLKFDINNYTDSKKDYADYRLKIGLVPEEKLFVAGSTHSGEEEMIIASYKDLLKEFPGLRLLIAPRHPDRAQEVEKTVTKGGFTALRVSQCKSSINPGAVFILDTVGSLMNFYGAADIVFVGGSLIKKGGHNILEPASLGKPVIFGPHMFNFRDIARAFLNNNAAIKVEGQDGLEVNIGELLRNSSKAVELAKNAKMVIAENQGATLRSIEAIKTLGRV